MLLCSRSEKHEQIHPPNTDLSNRLSGLCNYEAVAFGSQSSDPTYLVLFTDAAFSPLPCWGAADPQDNLLQGSGFVLQGLGRSYQNSKPASERSWRESLSGLV